MSSRCVYTHLLRKTQDLHLTQRKLIKSKEQSILLSEAIIAAYFDVRREFMYMLVLQTQTTISCKKFQCVSQVLSSVKSAGWRTVEVCRHLS
jgi:hypothetical protein